MILLTDASPVCVCVGPCGVFVCVCVCVWREYRPAGWMKLLLLYSFHVHVWVRVYIRVYVTEFISATNDSTNAEFIPKPLLFAALQ
jgi:hypothetical protein